MNSTEVDFVLTVPAVWSDAAKNATLQAAERAGMGNRHELKLISEPEAAAVYTLKTIQPSGLKVGDNFIVCDAGGGTVDLIAYKVTQASPLRVEESAVGTGGLCGSAFLNYRFEDHVKERIGEERYNTMREKKPKTWMMGLRYFEEFVKRNFNEEEHSEVNVPFPGLPDDEEAGLESGFLVMTAEQVKIIFEPVIKQVIELVEGQVDAIKEKNGRVSGIILVGGFGQSNYLYTRLKKHFNSAPPPPYSERPTHEIAASQSVEVLQPLHAWTAVVRGAVLRGIEGSLVEKRRSRWHYGTSYATVFDEAVHPIGDRYWSPLWERWMVSDRMQWHVNKVRRSICSKQTYQERLTCVTGNANIRRCTDILPLHSQLSTRPITRCGRRSDRMRRRRSSRCHDQRSDQRVHTDNGSQCCAKESLHQAHYEQRHRIRQPGLRATYEDRECAASIRAPGGRNQVWECTGRFPLRLLISISCKLWKSN